MEPTMRLLVEAACVSVFVVTLTIAGVRVQPRLLLVLRYTELRAARFKAELPRPDMRGFVLRPLLALLAIGGPALTLFVLVRSAGGWPPVMPAAVLLAVWPLAAGALALVSSRSPWVDVREVLTRALAMPADRRDEVIVAAFGKDPQLRAAAAEGAEAR